MDKDRCLTGEIEASSKRLDRICVDTTIVASLHKAVNGLSLFLRPAVL